MLWIQAMVIHFINTPPPSNPSQTNHLNKTLTLKKKRKKSLTAFNQTKTRNLEHDLVIRENCCFLEFITQAWVPGSVCKLLDIGYTPNCLWGVQDDGWGWRILFTNLQCVDVTLLVSLSLYNYSSSSVVVVVVSICCCNVWGYQGHSRVRHGSCFLLVHWNSY